MPIDHSNRLRHTSQLTMTFTPFIVLLTLSFSFANGLNVTLKNVSLPIEILLPRNCVDPPDSGEKCSDGRNASMRFYHSAVDRFGHQRCLAFAYNGCGGNGNNFETLDDCARKCYLPDGSGCHGNSEQPIPLLNYIPPFLLIDDNNQTITTTTLNPRLCSSYSCPPEFECRQMWPMPQCCNATAERSYKKATNKTCPKGQKALSEFNGEYSTTIFAQSCKDLICPQGHQCIQTDPNDFAKCCKNTEPKKDIEIPEIMIFVPNCQAAKESGVSCSAGQSASSMRFYHEKYDGFHQRCLAFVYNGCEGNGNNFLTIDACQEACYFEDGGGCHGNSERPIPLLNYIPPFLLIDDNNQTITTTTLNPNLCSSYSCPPEFECHQLWPAPQCCNATAERYYQEATNKICPSGDKALSEFNGDYSITIFGKTCSDLLCPEGHQCVQANQNVLAKCCKKDVGDDVL